MNDSMQKAVEAGCIASVGGQDEWDLLDEKARTDVREDCEPIIRAALPHLGEPVTKMTVHEDGAISMSIPAPIYQVGEYDLYASPQPQADDEAREDAWDEFQSNHLTDGNDGWVDAAVIKACSAAFDEAWPNGADAAHAAAKAVYDMPHPRQIGAKSTSAQAEQQGAVTFDDDKIIKLARKHLAKYYDALTFERSPPMFPQATYDVPKVELSNFVHACVEAALAARQSATVLTNPYTGTPRDIRDVESDPDGILIVKPGEPLWAEKQAAYNELSALRTALQTIVNSEEFRGDSFVCDFETLQGIARSALAARQPSAVPSVPEGWALVPVELTPEMLEAVGTVDGWGEEALSESADVAHANWWKAMIAAAPLGVE